MARKVSLAAAKVASNKAALQCVISDLTASPIAYFERTSRFDPSARVHAGSRFQSTSAKASTNLTAPKVTTSWLSALFGGGTSKPKAHRPFGRHEEAHLRLATRKTNKILKANPGARVEPKFLTEEDAQMLVEEAMDIINIYGISHVSEEQRDFLASQLKHFPLPKEDLRALINMQRVTGRFEDEAQKLAPWGYGDDFQVDQVPPALRKVLESIQDSPHFCVGKPRDITINRREKSFYRLDPHIDPSKDGGNVFILSLLSGTVMTLTPTSRTMHPDQHKAMDTRKVAEVSWLPGKDIDVDLPVQSLLHLSGDARYTWCHGIRPGVTQSQISDFNLGGVMSDEMEGVDQEAVRTLEGLPLWDWWGSMKNLRRRGPERVSIIFAFADPE